MDADANQGERRRRISSYTGLVIIGALQNVGKADPARYFISGII